jgi:hypothetical protein
MQVTEFMEDGLIEPNKLAKKLRISKGELENTLGLPAHTLSEPVRASSEDVQTSLQNLLKILITVLPITGTLEIAFAWYRSEPIVGFGGRSPEQILKDGEYEAFSARLRRQYEGGYS